MPRQAALLLSEWDAIEPPKPGHRGPGKGWSRGKQFAERRLCEQCGKPFYAPPVQRRRGGGRFCSNACRGASMFKENITRSCRGCGVLMVMPRTDVRYRCARCAPKEKTNLERKCLHCGRISKQTLFCDSKCYSAYRTANAKPRTLKPNASCRKCGAPFYASPGHKRAGQGLYCSLRCRPASKHGRGKGGIREDLGIYLRSTWEANYARYLKWLQEIGCIRNWEYEPETFEFTPIKRGVRFYTPDFRVTELDGVQTFREVKGYLDAKSQTKLRRMQQFYPEHIVVLIGPQQMLDIKGKCASMIPNWERGSNGKL